MDSHTWLRGCVQSYTVSTAVAELPQERIFNIYLFIWLRRVLVAACELLAVACMWDLVP